MKDFSFKIVGEVAGSWKPGGEPEWRTVDGDHFFLATWTCGDTNFGWFGIYHESLSNLEEAARRLADDCPVWIDDRRKWADLAALSDDTPGWGLVLGRKGHLRLWRDPIGRLPIFWMHFKTGMEWGSRPSAMEGFDPRIGRSRIEGFLTRNNDLGRNTFWESVYRLRAGEQIGIVAQQSPKSSVWWPPVITEIPSNHDVAETIRVLLTESLEKTVSRGGKAVSLSGGVDSTLLISLMAAEGQQPLGVSMVDPTTEIFHERDVIESSLAELGVEGHFFDIGGPGRWHDLKVHHPYLDLGPAAFPEASYFSPFLEQVHPLLKQESQSVLVSGVGADQIFGCNTHNYIRDRMHSLNGWKEAIKHGEYQIVASQSLKKLGIRIVPRNYHRKGAIPWIPSDNSSSLRWRRTEPFSRNRWRARRVRQFRTWSWEHTIALLERYRRTTGVLMDLPYLNPRLVLFVFALWPTQVRTAKHTKWPLRELLGQQVSRDTALRQKHGVFDEVVWRGLANFTLPHLQKMFTQPRVENLAPFDTLRFREEIEQLRFRLNSTSILYGHEFWSACAMEIWLRELSTFKS